MNAFHEEVAVADDGFAAFMRGTVNDYVLTNDVIVADDELTLFAAEIEILWQCAQDCTLMHLVVAAHLRAVEDTREWKKHTVVANYYVVFNIHERKYLAVVADFSFR